MTLLGYVIPKNDIKVELKPKRTTIDMGLKNHLPQTYVDMEYISTYFPKRRKEVPKANSNSRLFHIKTHILFYHIIML